jgi:hypothetical protein
LSAPGDERKRPCEKPVAIIAQDTHLRVSVHDGNVDDMAAYAVFGIALY